MAETYKNVLEAVVERLWADPNILALAAFGSSEDGTAIDGSDIDLFAVESGEEKVWKSVYLRELGVLVHLRYLSKGQLGECARMVRGGPFHRAFASSRLLRVRDDEVESLFKQRAHFSVADQRLRLMEAAGNLCLETHQLKKLVESAKPRPGRSGEPGGAAKTEAEPWVPQAARVLEGLAKVVVLTAGSVPSRGPLAQAVKFDPALKEALGLLERPTPGGAGKILALAEERIDQGIADWCRPLVAYLKEQGRPFSIDELENAPAFRDLKTDFERLSLALARRGIITETRRPFAPTKSSSPLAEEVVFTV